VINLHNHQSWLCMVTIILDDYLKTNPGVKDLLRPGIEPQPPSPQSDAITIRPWRPHGWLLTHQGSSSEWLESQPVATIYCNENKLYYCICWLLLLVNESLFWFFFNKIKGNSIWNQFLTLSDTAKKSFPKLDELEGNFFSWLYLLVTLLGIRKFSKAKFCERLTVKFNFWEYFCDTFIQKLSSNRYLIKIACIKNCWLYNSLFFDWKLLDFQLISVNKWV